HQFWRVAVTSEQATLVLPTMYWAGWTAADGRGNPLSLQPAVGSGLMEITVPQGEQTVYLQLTRTPIRATAEWISVAAVLLCVGLAAVSGRGTAGHFSLVLERRRLLALMMAVAAVVVLPFLNNLVARPFSANTLTWDFGEMGYLHHAPQGIPYGNGAHLASYEVAAETVTAGQTVDITLDWAAQPEGDIREVMIVLTNPAHNFYNFVPPIAADIQPLQIGSQQYQLQIPANAPAGLYFPLVTLSDNNRPRTLDGKLRAALSLSPVRVLPAQVATFETAQQLDIRPLQVTQRLPTVLDLQLAWYTAVPRPENLKMSLRLTNAGGAEIFEAQFDNQPGYGYRPTVGWAAGQWTNDWLSMRLPDNLPFPPPYKLVVQLYEQMTNQRLLTRRLGELTLNEQGELVFQENLPVMTLPEGLTTADVVYKDQAGQPIIALRGYVYEREGDLINLTLYWEALAAGA
ncbi:MAG: hypothetical protein KDE51_12940, partial [Anaerolineales bacterium]|nr:hypothetical protein [Anaerolineales bacterium]